MQQRFCAFFWCFGNLMDTVNHMYVSSGRTMLAEEPGLTMANFKFRIWKILCQDEQSGKIHHIFFCFSILFVHSKLISFFLFLFCKTLGCAYEPTLISDSGFFTCWLIGCEASYCSQRLWKKVWWVEQWASRLQSPDQHHEAYWYSLQHHKWWFTSQTSSTISKISSNF